jgi:hypothetical protein
LDHAGFTVIFSAAAWLLAGLAVFKFCVQPNESTFQRRDSLDRQNISESLAPNKPMTAPDDHTDIVLGWSHFESTNDPSALVKYTIGHTVMSHSRSKKAPFSNLNRNIPNKV